MLRKFVILSFFVLLCASTVQSTNPPIEFEFPELDEYGRVSKSELLDQKKLVLDDKDHQVVSFCLICTNDQLRAHQYKSGSAALTPAMLQQIRQSSSIERFMITDVLVNIQGDTTRLHPFTFFLKQ